MRFGAFLRANAQWLAAGMLLTLVSSFGQTFFISIFAGEIRAEFNLSHGAWGGLYSLGTMASAVVMIWAGGLTDIFRVRHLGAFVFLGLAGACVAMATVSAAWALPFVIFSLRLAGQGMLPHVSAVGMARWFVAARGRALAIASLGFAAGEALLPLIFVALLGFYSWRSLWIGCAVVVVLLIPLLMLLLRQERTPRSVAEETHASGMAGIHWTRNGALRHWLFWALAPALVAPSAFVTSFFFQQVHIAEVKGWSHAAFVALIPIYTIVSVLSALGFGWLIDRIGTGRLMPIYQLPLALGFVLFGLAHSPWAAGGAMAVMALTQGGQSTLSSAFWAEFYGTRHLGSIKAMAAAVMVLGSAIGPAITGALIDLGVNFEQQMFGIAAYITLASSIVAVAVGRVRKTLAIAP